MFIKLLKSKLHRATVTHAKLHYPGSIEIDSELMRAADIAPYEAVVIADLNNGNRLETYAVPAQADSGKVVILGAAARLIKPKNIIIIFLASAITRRKKQAYLNLKSLFSRKTIKLETACRNSG